MHPHPPTPLVPEFRHWLLQAPLAELTAAAAAVRDRSYGNVVTYSRKVFVPLTQLCRDVCGYCTFAKRPRELAAPFLSLEQVLDIARRGQREGCKEVLFTLGDKPELRYAVALEALQAMGYASTVDYLAAACEAVLAETGMLPHVNAGVMTRAELARLRGVSVSQGLMLESISQRLLEKGQVHHGSPDKEPARRLAMIAAAGELQIPFTSGLLLGIGETAEETLDGLAALAELHRRHGHLQEVIVQNFLPKAGTRAAATPPLGHAEHLRAIAIARLVLPGDVALQAPPNLTPTAYRGLLAAGINDWGGISPVTPDHVNPEAPWPHLEALERQSAAAGFTLQQRLALYPHMVREPDRWVDDALRTPLLRWSDAEGFAREDAWYPGGLCAVPPRRDLPAPAVFRTDGIRAALRSGEKPGGPSMEEVGALFRARGAEEAAVLARADALRRASCGDSVSYVVNRNINYTNLCTYRCTFCAFSKSTSAKGARETPYDISDGELTRRVREAWDRGAGEVCLQGGIHPDYSGHKYLEIVRLVRQAEPRMHVHAFSPLEILQGARTLGLSVPVYLAQLKRAGLSTLPGTAAEILSDEVRRVICPDKLSADEWIGVMRDAHGAGLRSTATIMFGHVDRVEHWAEHLLRIRALQVETGGFTEFVPLPFVHTEAPMYRKGEARPGPTFREAILMHAVARIVFHGVIDHIQTSWVKMGPEGAVRALGAGADDIGGTLTNESISRAAGTRHGQEMGPDALEALIRSAGRTPRARTTLYGDADLAQVQRARTAAPAAPVELTSVRKGRYRSFPLVSSVSPSSFTQAAT
ncbi:MAG: 5-amino-6-(D-ribitylamino)uracil--L-tyrosine 4-hydroxyphenyl transferase CofH [Pseudomonadota bacterium]